MAQKLFKSRVLHEHEGPCIMGEQSVCERDGGGEGREKTEHRAQE